jgi:hypothetical protein
MKSVRLHRLERNWNDCSCEVREEEIQQTKTTTVSGDSERKRQFNRGLDNKKKANYT